MILDSFRLTGKNALVTGSSRGMGAAIAIALAQAGANVALHASQSVPADVIQSVAETGVRHVALTADLTNPDSVPGLVEQAIVARHQSHQCLSSLPVRGPPHARAGFRQDC
jgi:NAD(P)-dependent dehydrogenase (short-subunit alcohol dehydrogenase family)